MMAEDKKDKKIPGSGRPVSPDGCGSRALSGSISQVDVEAITTCLQVACENSQTSTLFVKNIKNCVSILADYPSEKYDTFITTLLSSESFSQALDRLSFKTLVPEFTNRDYFSYDESDFSGQCDITKCVLEFFVKFISSLRSSKETLKASVEQRSKCDDWNADEELSVSVIGQKLSSRLPNLVLMVAGNVRNPMWSSQACQELSIQLNQLLLDLYGCERIADIFTLSIDSIDISSSKYADKSLLTFLLHRFKIPLSRERWEKNPFLCEAFLWFVTQLISSQLSLCLNQILAVVLNFLHSFDVSHKLKGLQLLRHLIDNVTNEELCWYNRAEVIYDALKTEMYSKEILVLDGVITCVFSVLQILEKPHGTGTRKKHHFVLSTLLTSAEDENLISLRRIYISHLAKFILFCEAICIAHLQNILLVIKCYLEIDDGPDETARISALDALQNVLKVTWPRIGLHSTTILKFLLRFVIDINSLSFMDTKGKDLKKIFEDKVIDCLVLLNKLNPSVKTCLDALQESDHHSYLDSLLKLWSNVV